MKENKVVIIQIPNAIRDMIIIEKSLDGDEEYWLQHANKNEVNENSFSTINQLIK